VNELCFGRFQKKKEKRKMKGQDIRSRFSRCLGAGRPPSAGPIDFEIQALGGGNTNTILLNKLPLKDVTVSPQVRIAELEKEIQQLTHELKYYQSLTNEVLLRIMPTLHYHSSRLFSLVRKCDSDIERVFAEV
jgi:hypothetical protein